MAVTWHQELDNLQDLVNKGISIQAIGKMYGVSHQRVYQVLTKFGISTTKHVQRNFLRDLSPKHYWLNRLLCGKGLSKEDRKEVLETTELPDYCPILGLELNYNGTGKQGWTRGENSPSVDQIRAGRGYTRDNIQIISWRANRLKNDSTPEELRKLADYMERFQD